MGVEVEKKVRRAHEAHDWHLEVLWRWVGAFRGLLSTKLVFLALLRWKMLVKAAE